MRKLVLALLVVSCPSVAADPRLCSTTLRTKPIFTPQSAPESGWHRVGDQGGFGDGGGFGRCSPPLVKPPLAAVPGPPRAIQPRA